MWCKPAYAEFFYPVQNLPFVTSSESLVIQCKRSLFGRYLFIFALFSVQLLEQWHYPKRQD